MNESISDVEYEPRTELDYGTLLCLAENTVSHNHHHHHHRHHHRRHRHHHHHHHHHLYQVGSQQTPCMFHVVPAGRPDPVSNCTVCGDIVIVIAIVIIITIASTIRKTMIMRIKIRKTTRITIRKTIITTITIRTTNLGEQPELDFHQ